MPTGGTKETRSPSLEERIAAAEPSLGPTERQVARFFADHRDEVPFMSAMGMAGVLKTSNATVIRTAQALGYSGLLELKNELGLALRSGAGLAARLGRSLDELGGDSDRLIESMIAFDVRLLEEARDTLSTADFREAVQQLHRAQRIALLATPAFYRHISRHFAMCLRRYGRDAWAMTSQGPGLSEELVHVRPGDLVVAIAYDKAYEELVVTLDHAKAVGCPSVLITDALQLALRGRYTVALAARRGNSSLLPTTVVTLMLIEALTLGLAGQDPERALTCIEQINTMRESLISS